MKMKDLHLKCFSSTVLGLFCVGYLSAKETSWSASRTDDWDWNKSSNFTNGNPQDGDTVIVPENMVVYATNDTARTLINGLSRIILEGTRPSASDKGTCSTLVIDVPTGQYELACALNEANASEASGSMRKTGSGTLVLAERGNIKEYYTDFDVEAGVLDLRNLDNGVYYIGALGIAEEATVVGPNKDLILSGIYGNGRLTADSASDLKYSTLSGTAADPYVFSGKINGGITFRVRGAQYLTGTESDNSMSYVYSYSASKPGVLGVRFLGNRADSGSSIGKSQNIWFGKFGGKIVYLGSGEVTDKSVKIDDDNHGFGPVVIDGGANGGLVVNGDINIPGKYMMSFVLDGKHKNPCVIGGRATYSTDDNGNRCSVHFVKRGSGTWCFLGATNRTNSTGFTIEEGVLQFDDIAKKGERSGLGTAYDTHTNYFGVYNAAAEKPWAFALGTPRKEGTLEYVGTNGAYSTGRTIGLAGAGRLSCESDAPLRFSGVMPIGEGAKTFTVAGSGTNENTIADIADAVDAPITSVKEGSGNWILANTNVIRGGLEVKAGRLTVRNPSGKYDWFRWTIRQTFGLYDNEQCVAASQFGLYDKDRKRINCGWVHSDNMAYLSPGQAAYESRLPYADKSTLMNGKKLGELFDPDTGSDRKKRWGVVMPKNMSPGSPDTHLKILMRTTNGTPEAVRYDFAVRSQINGSYYLANPLSWCLEGSRDGIHWDMLHDMPTTNSTMFCRAENYRYYAAGLTSNGTSNENNLTTTVDAPVIAGSASRNINVMSGFAYVKVSEGAVLAADGDNLEISSLRIDSTGAGAIDGFAFAEVGTLDVLGVPNAGRVVLPGIYDNNSGLSNLTNWALTIDGEATRRRISVENNNIVLVNPGMRVILR